MAQDAGEGLGIHAAGQRVSGEGVTQIMEPDVRQSCLFQQYLHPVVGGAGPHRLLRRQWVREDPLADGMFLPLLQPLDGAGRETDGAPAPFRFRFADLQFTPLGGIHRAEDLQCPGARIEVLPHETADLTSAQAGGQLADQGEILSDDGAVLEVDDVQKPIKDLIVHQCRLTEGTLVVGAEVNANIDLDRRGAIARSHTATHMVHKALREELGPQATQRGSEDAPNRLRFDFQWSSAPSKDAMNSVEARVNEKLRENLAVTTQEMKFDDAIALGAMHLFGEKYGDVVRVVSIGEDGWSRELCGGTHIDHVGKIGAINIMSEASIGSGVRRVDAVVGESAYEFNAREHALVSQLSDMVNARPDELADRVNALLAKLKESDRRLAAMYESQLAASVPTLVAEAKASSAPVKVAKKNVGHFGSFDALRKTVLDDLVRGDAL